MRNITPREPEKPRKKPQKWLDKKLTDKFGLHHNNRMGHLRRSTEEAFECGKVVMEAAAKYGYRQRGEWKRQTCELYQCSMATLELYHTIAKRLSSYPEVQEQVLAMTLTEARDALQKYHYEHRSHELLKNFKLDNVAAVIDEALEAICEQMSVLQEVMPESEWDAWSDTPTEDYFGNDPAAKACADLLKPILAAYAKLEGGATLVHFPDGFERYVARYTPVDPPKSRAAPAPPRREKIP